MPKYPNIRVKLIGENGNVFNLMGIIAKALRKNGVGGPELSKFTSEVMFAGGYDDALRIMMEWVTVE